MPLVADAAPLRSKIRVARLRAVFPAPTTFYFFRYRSFLVFVAFFFFSSSFLGNVLLSLLLTFVLCFAFLSRRLCERAHARSLDETRELPAPHLGPQGCSLAAATFPRAQLL